MAQLPVALIRQITVKKADSYGFAQAGRAKANDLKEFFHTHRQAVENSESALTELFQVDQTEELVAGFRIGKGLV